MVYVDFGPRFLADVRALPTRLRPRLRECLLSIERAPLAEKANRHDQPPIYRPGHRYDDYDDFQIFFFVQRDADTGDIVLSFLRVCTP